MKLKPIIKRMTAGILSAALLGLCGCGSKTAEPVLVELEHCYHTESLPTELESSFGLAGLSGNGDQIYLTGYFDESYEDEAESYVQNEGLRLYRLNEAQQPELMKEFKNEYHYDEENCTANVLDYRAFAADSKGGCWYLETVSQYDWSGDETISRNLMELVHETAEGDRNIRKNFLELLPEGVDTDYIYAEQMLISENGDVMVRGTDFVVVTNAFGDLQEAFTFEQNQENSYLQGCAFTGAGDLIMLYAEYSENSSRSVLKRLTAQGVEELGEIPLPYCSHILSGSGHTVYLDGGYSIYQYDIETKNCEEKLNWLNSDINSSRVVHIYAAADGSFLVSESVGTGSYYGINGYEIFDGRVRLSRLTPPAEGESVRRAVINLAAVYLDSSLQDAMIGFNRRNEVYRICFKDYSVYNTDDNYDGGTQALAKDIAAGNMPDMFFTDGLPLLSLARQGSLMDIGKLIDEDKSMNRSDYLENIFKALELDGKLYSVIPAFYIETLAGKTENVGDRTGWTLSELKALCEKYPEASVLGYMERSSVMFMFMEMALDHFIDRNKGTCNFKTQDFYDFLTFAAEMPETIDWGEVYGDDYDWEAEENILRESRQLLEAEYLYGFDECRNMEYRFGGDYSFVGFPVPEGYGASVNPLLELAVSAKTPYRDACAEFIRYLLSPEYQDYIESGFPVLRSSLNKRAEKAQAEKKTERWTSYEEGDVRGLPAAKEQTDRVIAAIEAADHVWRSDSELSAIIEEELAPYFAGQQSAESVAEKLQSRVSLYLSEKQ